jgi:acyl-coenzyme A thioesterase PaaI-like protein
MTRTKGDITIPPSSSMARVVTALRRTMKAMYHVHPSHDDEAMAEAAEQLAEAAAAAGTLPLGQDSDVRYTRNPLTGTMNPIAPPAEYEYGDNSIIGRIRFHEGYQGPPAVVHGGMVAALFDDVLGRTRHFTGRNCVTGSLSISYKKPTPLNADLIVKATIKEVHERKFLSTGELSHNGETLAIAEAIFVFRDEQKFNALVSDARQASR